MGKEEGERHRHDQGKAEQHRDHSTLHVTHGMIEHVRREVADMRPFTLAVVSVLVAGTALVVFAQDRGSGTVRTPGDLVDELLAGRESSASWQTREKLLRQLWAHYASVRDAVIREIRLRPSTTDVESLRLSLLEIGFDGQTTVQAPLGDFFGSGPGLNPYESIPMSVGAGGELTSR